MDHQAIYYNANIYTMDNTGAVGCSRASGSSKDRTRERPSAIAVRGDRIVQVGTYADAESALTSGYRKIDLQGLTVVPGFTDCHIHLLWYALKSGQVDLGCVESIEDVKTGIEERALQSKEGEWIIGYGWSDHQFGNCRPHREQLDEVAPDNPVALSSKDRHSKWVNSLALAMAGINKDTPDPDGGVIERDPKAHKPTGILRENAQLLNDRVIPVPLSCL